MADYNQHISEYCDPSFGRVLERFSARFDADAAVELEKLFSARDEKVPPVLCAYGMTGTLAKRIEPSATPDYVKFLLGRMWALFGQLSADPAGVPFLSRTFMQDLHDVYARLPYAPPSEPSTYPKLWFGCAWDIGVDLRPRPDMEVAPDWSFGENYLFSQTWAWAKYHCHHGTPEVLEATKAKLDSIKDGNLQIGLLRDLMVALRIGPPARALLETYLTSRLVTDCGIDGAPTPMVGEEVAILLRNL